MFPHEYLTHHEISICRSLENARFYWYLTHWGRVTHICVSKLTIIGSDNGLSPGRRQAIIWTNVGILLNGTLGIYFSEILSEIHTFSFKKMHLKMSSAKRRPFCLGLNVLTMHICVSEQWHRRFRWWLVACSVSNQVLVFYEKKFSYLCHLSM